MIRSMTVGPSATPPSSCNSLRGHPLFASTVTLPCLVCNQVIVSQGTIKVATLFFFLCGLSKFVSARSELRIKFGARAV